MSIYHRTKDGREILISHLGTRHLKNIIALLERKSREGLKVEFVGGTPPDDMWPDEDYLYDEDALEIMNYSAYVDELERREIK